MGLFGTLPPKVQRPELDAGRRGTRWGIIVGLVLVLFIGVVMGWWAALLGLL